jgi:GLPGLI family protein
MKRTILTLSMVLALLAANGQQKEGRVLYERTVKLRMGPGDVEQMMPRLHKDKLEVLFGNDQSLRRPVDDNTQEEMTAESGGARHVYLMIDGNNDVTYTNFGDGRITEQREFGAKNYIVTDSIRKLNWKLTGETDRTELSLSAGRRSAHW